MAEDHRLPALPTPGSAEGERDPGDERPRSPRAPAQMEGERAAPGKKK